MPIFEFHCRSCGRDFDELVRSADHVSLVACPKCSSKGVERKISVFAAHAAAPSRGCPVPAEVCGGRCEPGGPCGLM